MRRQSLRRQKARSTRLRSRYRAGSKGWCCLHAYWLGMTATVPPGAGCAARRRRRRRRRRRTGRPVRRRATRARRRPGRASTRRRAAGRGWRRPRLSPRCGRRVSGRSPAFGCAGGRAVRLGDRAVEQVHIVRFGLDQGVQQALPQAAPGPAMEAVVDRGRRAVGRWTILPATAGAQKVDDPAQDPAIVDATCRGQEWRDDGLLPISEPQLAGNDPSFTVCQLEERPPNPVNSLIEFGA